MGLCGRIFDPLVLTWNVGSLVTVFLPLISFTVARLINEEDWNYDDQQQQDNNYDNPEYYDQYGNYVGPTHWWQFWRRNNNGQGGGQGEVRAPWWYVWGNRQEQDPDQQGNSSVLFVYIWLLVCFGALIYLGNSTGNESSKLEGMRWALVGFANVCLTTMILLVGLEAIEVDERELEEDGFYGQTSVLLFLTCFFGLVQSIVFIGWTGKRLAAQQILPEKSEGYVHVNYERSPSHSFMGVGV